MQAAPFKLFGSTELARVGEAASAAATAWAQDWGLTEDGSGPWDVEALEREAQWRAAAPWIRVVRGPAAAYLACTEALLADTARRLFGPIAAAQPSALAAEVARRAAADLLQRCLPGAEPPVHAAEPPPRAAGRRGSGALLLRRVHDGATLVLDAEAARRVLAPRTPAARGRGPRPIDLRAAIGRSRVDLRAWTGSAEMDIATLRSLAPGDVIRLDLRVDEPLRLSIGGSASSRRAFLGSRDGARALRLTAAGPAAHPLSREGTHVDPLE